MLRRKLTLLVPSNTAMCSTSAAASKFDRLRQVLRRKVSNDIHLSRWYDRGRIETFSESVAFTSNEKWRWATWSKVIIFTSGQIAFWLGVWNFAQAGTKKQILQTREMEPLEGNQISLSNDNFEFLRSRRIVCKGLYDEKKSMYVARKRYWCIDDGYNLLTPLVPIPGDPESVQSPILVNRGWFPHPQSLKSEASNGSEMNSLSTNTRHSANKSGWSFWYKKLLARKVTETPISIIRFRNQVTGVVYPSEVNIFNLADGYASAKWVMDTSALARACGLPEETICVEDLNVNVANPNNSRALTADEYLDRGLKLFIIYVVTFIMMKILKRRTRTRTRKGSVYKCEANF